MGITTEANAELVQRLYQLVGDISIVERALLRFDQELQRDEELRNTTGAKQLEKLLYLLALENHSAQARGEMVRE